MASSLAELSPRERRLRVVFGETAPGLPGGIRAAEVPFQEALAATGRILVRGIPFGRRRRDESLAERIGSRISDLARYAALVRRERPDLVHLNTALNPRALVRDVGYVAISRTLGQPVFLKMHGTRERLLRTRSPFWRRMLSAVVRGASGIGVLSTEEQAAFAAAGFDVARVHVVPNAVDRRPFARARWPRPGPPRLLFIARFIASKGLLDVIDAMHLMRATGRTVFLTCVGDGPLRREAEVRCRALSLTDRVTFTGLIPEEQAAAYYLESTMLVLPTSAEAFSMSVFQSLAAGLPIVTTRIRAAADHLREPDHCVWVRPEDPRSLAERAGWLLDHPEVMAAMSGCNREHAKRFDPDRVAAQYLPIYLGLARPAEEAEARPRRALYSSPK